MDTSTSTSAANPLYDEPITLEKIQHALKILKKFERPTIYIWNGIKFDDEFWYNNFLRHMLPDKPRIIDSEYLLVDDDKFFIVAGLGIVANKKVADILRKLNLNLLWSDYPADFEEQKKMFKEIFDRLFE